MPRKILKYSLWIIGIALIGIFTSNGIWTASAELAIKSKTPLYKISGTYSYYVKDKDKKMRLSAEAFAVGDIESGETIFSRNKDIRYPIASVSKLVTALVAKDMIKEKDNTIDLLYPLLLRSDNEVAKMLADTAGFAQFIRLANDQTLALGMTNTILEEPSGLSAQNKSTAGDLFKLARYLNNSRPDILKITAKNKWRGYAYLGGKTGYTDAAKQTLLAIFEVKIGGKEKRKIAILLLQSADRLNDVNQIINYLKENIVYKKTVLADIEAIGGSDPPMVPKETTLIFAGDLMLDRGVKRSVYRNFSGDYKTFLQNLSFLKEADVAFANLEGNISDKGKDTGKTYSFRMEPKALDAIAGTGIDALSVANNHAGDWGRSAFTDTVKRLKEKNIAPIGGDLGRTEAEKPKIIERNGLKIGFLGFTDVGPNWLEVQENQAGILLASDPRFKEIIANAKTQVDFLVTSFHWGEEYQKPTERQKKLAHDAIDAGADIVVGHHPHVVQDTENYKNGLIIYSLGNLVFDQYFSEATMQGLIVKVTLKGKNISKVDKNLIKLARNYQPTELIAYSPLVLSMKANPDGVAACPKPNQEFQDLSLFNVSQENSLGDYVPENLIPLSKNITNGLSFCLQSKTAEALGQMLKSAQGDSLILVVTSAYRAAETQEELFSNAGEKNSGEHLLIAPPEHSEHQLGTTVDLTGHSINYEKATFTFEDSPEYTWMKDNAYKFGFVESYPKGKENITGYRHEPWHWRYVGPELAQKIKDSGLTVTEFLSDESSQIGG